MSELYRLVYHHRDELSYVWEQRFQPHYGALRDEVLKALDAYLNCGIVVHGAARATCHSCKHSRLIAFSCKKRGVCPSCATKRSLIFAENLHVNVLETVPHRHAVFTLPKRLRPYFRYNRKLHQVLFKAAWESVHEMYQALMPDGIPAAVLALHSAGDALNHNPHVHGIIADGVFQDDTFTPLPKLSVTKLHRLFAHKVMSALKRKRLITDTVIAQITCQNHSGFSAWLGKPIKPQDSEQRLFVAKYIDKGPVANSRIEINADIITYKHDNDYLPTAEFDPLEFLAAVSAQIPNKWEQLTRHYGYYSTRARGERKKKQIVLEHIDTQQVDKKKASSLWASLIKRVYEVNPLLCPRCGEQMKIVAFILDTVELRKIEQHLGIPKYRAPPPLDIPQPYLHPDIAA